MRRSPFLARVSPTIQSCPQAVATRPCALLRHLLPCLVLILGILLPGLLPTPLSAQRVPFLAGQHVDHLAELDFDTLNTRDGLPHQSVYGFTQDTAGFLWIVTYGGLSRFDGYHLRSYTHDPARADSLHDNNLRVLLPAPNGDLWIGSDTAGVFRYRAATDTFEDLPNLPAALRRVRVYALADDGYSGLWIGGQFGLAHFDAVHNTYEIFPALVTDEPTPASGFSLQRVFSLHLDRTRTLWIGGAPGVLTLTPGAHHFTHVQGIEGEHEVGRAPQVWSFLEDHTGRIWVGCDHVGLATYDPASHLLRGVPGLSGDVSEVGEHTVRGLLEHAPGQIWIATYGGGLITYDTQDGFIRSFRKALPSQSPLHNNFLRDIFKDRSGVVWLATDNGVARINDATAGIFQIHPTLLQPDPLSNAEIRSLGVVDGQVWVGFDQGQFGPIDQYGRVDQILPAVGVPAPLITHREILAIRDTGSGIAYAAGTGIFRIDRTANTYHPLRDPLIADQIVSSLCPDGNTLWAGTYNGLYQLDLRTGRGRMLHHAANDPNSLSEDDVRDILRAHDGRLWISTRVGLDVRDPATGHFHSFRHRDGDPTTLPGDNVRSLAEDQLGRLWVATTGSGIAVLVHDDHTGPSGKATFRTLDTTSGLPSNSVLTLTLGKDGRIWANTAAGLSVIDPVTFAVKTYTAGDGLRSTSQKLFGSVTLDDGTLLFRGAEGLIAVQPDRLQQTTYPAPLVLTELHTSGSSASPITLAYQAMHSSLSLAAGHRGFAADLSLLDYTAADATRYAYRLQGVDKDWIQLPPGIHTLSYSDLPSGSFRLFVRASSRPGQPPTQASYTIAAPSDWDESFGFRFSLALLAIIFIYLLIGIRTHVLERRREHLERVIAERTTELDEQKHRLEEANLLLSQLAIRDPLSNLYNRRYFLELAESELKRSRRTGRPFCLLLMDIDHFKHVNDTFGHLTGDAVIQMVSDCIARSIRVSDTAARFGGEEFIVLLPETSAEQALLLAERIRASIASTNLPAAGQQIVVTISIGCAASDPDFDLTHLLERADRALYTAKDSGRDCIQIADPR